MLTTSPGRTISASATVAISLPSRRKYAARFVPGPRDRKFACHQSPLFNTCRPLCGPARRLQRLRQGRSGPITPVTGTKTSSGASARGSSPIEEALAFMEERAAAIRAGDGPECVWLLEHPPLFTAGTSADPAELFNPLGFPVYDAGRGGRYTYHGPGQRVGYLMLDLDERGRDVRRLVHSLEGWIIATLGDLGVAAHRADGRIGIWVGEGPSEAKIAALGIRVKRWVTLHGFAINVVARPFALRRHRPVRDQRIRRDEPAGAWERNAVGRALMMP